MHFKPATSYDADNKVWSGPAEAFYFAPDLSIGEIIYEEMRRHPKLIAQISDTENTILTREELLLNSIRVATYMRNQGLSQSDVVGIIARNTTDIFAITYACFFNGIAFQSLNILHDHETIERQFNLTKPRLIFCDGDEYEKVRDATIDFDVKIITLRNHLKDSISIDELLATPVGEKFQTARLEKGNDQTLAILCSSGTTGDPKAVTITNSRKILNPSPPLTTADVLFCSSTLDWLSGLLSAVISGVYSTTRIITDCGFDAEYFCHLVEKYKITWALLGSAHLAMMSNSEEFERADFSSLRYFTYGGSRCSLEVQHKLRRAFSVDCMHLAYGLTELGTLATVNYHFDEKPNSSGRLTNGFKLKIINKKGEAQEADEVGEICIYSGQYWDGYYRNPKESQHIRDDKLWYHTGDLGYMDDDGFLYIVERKKDMLKYKTMMYYPHEIENVISKMPEVAEVCVFGVWNPYTGDEAAAAVVKKLGSDLHAQDVLDYVMEHVDATYKQLNGGALIVDELKRSANGKTNRMATKAYFLEVKDRN
ncbi:luciferin 4-monooxygenase-like [Drosophila tropicalis]|uniref:luciferin 4-monooxygenase-like n=1 Tax=Drosophila tropicalis TaxID=46794 RepID=UPI0035ABB9F3